MFRVNNPSMAYACVMIAQEIVVLCENNAAFGERVRDVGHIVRTLKTLLVRRGYVNTSEPETDRYGLGHVLVSMKSDHLSNPCGAAGVQETPGLLPP